MKRECLCPKAKHRHGTRMAYELDRCRCFDCRMASHRATRAQWRGQPYSDGQFPSAVGVRRRLEALHTVGWSQAQIAARLGYTRRAVARYSDAENVLQATHDRIVSLYEELWNVTPTGKRVGATKNWARSRGFLPPLAWDDDTIDDPSSTGSSTAVCATADSSSTLDEIAVQEAVNGRRVALTKAERDEAVRRLTDAGFSAAQIADRLGTYRRDIQRVRARAA